MYVQTSPRVHESEANLATQPERLAIIMLASYASMIMSQDPFCLDTLRVLCDALSGIRDLTTDEIVAAVHNLPLRLLRSITGLASKIDELITTISVATLGIRG